MALRNARVKDYMTPALVVLKPEVEILEAISLLLRNRLSGAPVTDNRSRLVGFLSEKDCIRIALQSGYYGSRGGKVSDFMSHEVETIDIEASMIDVAERFVEKPYRRYPVTDNDQRLVGYISRRDVLRALEALWGEY